MKIFWLVVTSLVVSAICKISSLVNIVKKFHVKFNNLTETMTL